MNPISIIAGLAAAVAPSIPSAIETVWNYFTEEEEDPVKRTYKKRDTHQFTDEECRKILLKYKEYLEHKADPNGFKCTQEELAQGLNNELGLSKSSSSYRRVWSKVDK